MNFLENITFRRTRRQSEPSNDDSDIISQTLNCTSNSMPDISEDDDYNQIKILKDEIDTLKAQLNSAHHEVELLTLENNNLKLCNEELLKKNNLFQRIVSSPVNQKQTTPIKTSSNIKTKFKQTQTINLSKKIVGEDITSLDVCTKINIADNACTSSEREPVLQTTNTGRKTSPPLRTPPTSEPSTKHKIVLLSGETSNRLYSMAEKTYLNNFELCHYRKPKCGIELIFDNIDAKVRDLTECDYCIIYIGEEDFRTTHNYIELVTFIRGRLLPLNHTNFIICLPTFKYMENHNIMYNSRIETFNNLLYMDAQTCNYAYVLDSNLNLPYTYNTYNKRHNTLNNKGLNIIVSDLEQLVIKICSLDKVFSYVDCDQNNESDSLKQPELLSKNLQIDLSDDSDTNLTKNMNLFRSQ